MRHIAALLVLLFSCAAFSNEETTTVTPDYSYYTLSPDITTNFVTRGHRLGYLRLQVDLMVLTSSQIPTLEHHDALLRDAIIDIIGQQDEATIKSLVGREHIRTLTLEKLNELLKHETGEALITELLFTTYLYQ